MRTGAKTPVWPFGARRWLVASSMFSMLALGGSRLVNAGDEVETNRGKWIFDSAPIKATSPGGAGKSSFKWNDFIYARVFFDRSLKDVFDLSAEKYAIKVYEKVVGDGSAYDNVEIWIPKGDFDKKYLDVEIFPDPAKAHTKFGEYGGTFRGPFWQDHFKLTGKQKVIFEVQKAEGNDARAAIIEIDFTGLKKDVMQRLQKETAAAGNKAFAANVGLPKPGLMHSAGLAKQLEAMTKRGNRNLVAVKVVITGDEWNIERHQITNKVTGRTASAAVVTRDKSGTCMLDAGSMFRQKAAGKKFKAPGEWMTMAGTANQIDCSKIFGGKGKK